MYYKSYIATKQPNNVYNHNKTKFTAKDLFMWKRAGPVDRLVAIFLQ